jgi:hypothetical protein
MRGLRLLLIPLTVAPFALMIGLSGLIGRGIHTPMVVVDATGFGRPEQLIYEIIDIDRQLATQNTFTIPNEHPIPSEGYPGQVWQRIEHGDTVEWIFSHADGLTGQLIPRIAFTIPIEFDTAPGQFSVSQLWPEERWRAYVPSSGQILEASGGDPQARVLATLPTDARGGSRGVYWLDGGDRLALADAKGLTFMKLDGSEQKHVALDTQQLVFPSYSPDGKHMFVQSFEQMMSGTPVYDIPVYDAETLEVKATYTGRSPYWCEQHLTFLVEGDSGTPELHFADVGTEEMTRLPLDGITSSMQNLNSYGVWNVRDESCDVVMVNDGVRTWLILRENGMVILTDRAIVSEMNDTSLIYQVFPGVRDLEIRRVLLDGSEEPELLGTVRTLGQPITLFDGVKRGLYLRGVRLMLVDVASGTQTELAHRVSGRSFYLVP